MYLHAATTAGGKTRNPAKVTPQSTPRNVLVRRSEVDKGAGYFRSSVLHAYTQAFLTHGALIGVLSRIAAQIGSGA
jgi:hypothetical protein